MTLTEISKSAGREGWGGGNNESQFGYVGFEMQLSRVRKDVRRADPKEVPVNKHLLQDEKAHPNRRGQERLMCAYGESTDKTVRKR